MNTQLQDLDSTATDLRSQAAAALAARRAAWRDMTTRQRRRLTRAAIKDFEKWLEGRTGGRATAT